MYLFVTENVGNFYVINIFEGQIWLMKKLTLQ